MNNDQQIENEEIERQPIKAGNPFVFQAPAWVNSGHKPESPEEALQRARDISNAYYALGTQSGIHSMIEWCGVMTEYVKMLEVAHAHGIDPCEVDQHHADCVVEVPAFMVDYFTEKLGCQLKPFIRANPSVWSKAINDWFEGHPDAFLTKNQRSAIKRAQADLLGALQCKERRIPGCGLCGDSKDDPRAHDWRATRAWRIAASSDEPYAHDWKAHRENLDELKKQFPTILTD